MEGVVSVNGQPATLGMKADLEKDHIKVRGKLINGAGERVYLLFNKPINTITAMKDPEGRPTVNDYMKKLKVRVFPVGRLDYRSEGLLILTNDGDLANAVLHPSKKIPKTYRVKIDGFLDQEDINALESGIRLEDGKTAPAKVKVKKAMKANSWVDITIHEGKKRQVRRMFERLRHHVIKLQRIRISSLTLSGLESGAFRYMTPEEVQKLKKDTGMKQ